MAKKGKGRNRKKPCGSTQNQRTADNIRKRRKKHFSKHPNDKQSQTADEFIAGGTRTRNKRRKTGLAGQRRKYDKKTGYKDADVDSPQTTKIKKKRAKSSVWAELD